MPEPKRVLALVLVRILRVQWVPARQATQQVLEQAQALVLVAPAQVVRDQAEPAQVLEVANN